MQCDLIDSVINIIQIWNRYILNWSRSFGVGLDICTMCFRNLPFVVWGASTAFRKVIARFHLMTKNQTHVCRTQLLATAHNSVTLHTLLQLRRIQDKNKRRGCYIFISSTVGTLWRSRNLSENIYIDHNRDSFFFSISCTLYHKVLLENLWASICHQCLFKFRSFFYHNFENAYWVHQWKWDLNLTFNSNKKSWKLE